MRGNRRKDLIRDHVERLEIISRGPGPLRSHMSAHRLDAGSLARFSDGRRGRSVQAAALVAAG